MRCRQPPCAWWLDGARSGAADGEEGGGSAAQGGSVAFNSGGRIVVPQFFLPPLAALSVELFFSPACNTTGASATQSLFRLLTEATAFSPRMLVERGDLTAYLALNDAASNSSYFAVLRKLEAKARGGGADVNAVWGKNEWHHVAIVFEGVASKLWVDGLVVAVWQEDEHKQIGDTCVYKKDTRCVRGSGVAMGEGFNGRLQRVAVYDHALAPDRIQAHAVAFFYADAAAARDRAPTPPAARHAGRPWSDKAVAARSAMAEHAGSGFGFGGFAGCRLPWEERDAGMGAGLVPAVMSFVVMAVGLLAVLTAAILHLAWSNLAHGGGDLVKGIMSTRAAIPEHSVVLDAPPQYPWLVLAVLGVLLPLAYLSQWYDQADATARDGREAYLLEYLLWLAFECGGTFLLLAMSNMHDPQGVCRLLLLLVSGTTVVLCAAADLGGGMEGASRQSLCPREVYGPPPLDLGAGAQGLGSAHAAAGRLPWTWGCLPPMGWYALTPPRALSLSLLPSLPPSRALSLPPISWDAIALAACRRLTCFERGKLRCLMR